MGQRDGPEPTARGGTIVSRARRVDVPFGAVARAASGPRTVWTAPDEPDVIGRGAVVAMEADGPRRFETVRRRAAALFEEVDADGPEAARPRLLGGFAFHDEHEPSAPWTGFPGARFVLPHVQAVRVDGETWLSAIGRGPDPGPLDAELDRLVDAARGTSTTVDPAPGIERVVERPDEAGWRRQVEAALARIDADDVEKVVLAATRVAHLRGSFSLPDALARLGEAYPDCYRFAVEPGTGPAFFGATPERLVRLRGRRVETEALAGSAPRGATDAEDETLAGELRDSAKVGTEHGLVAAAIRDQLAPVVGDVSVGERSVRKLAGVQHLRTPITATLDEPRHVLSVAAALHPTPAVGGLPVGDALRTIRATEAFDRGWYAAPVGWLDGRGDGTFAVGIRSAVAAGGRATLFAGNGIVADSDPAEEWAELELKFRAILDHLR